MFDLHRMPVESLPGYVAMHVPPLREGNGPINPEVVACIRMNAIVAAICGDDFYGFVWRKDGVWWSEVQQEHRVVGLHVDADLERLITHVFTQYKAPLASSKPLS